MGKHNLINETRIEYNAINGVKNKNQAKSACGNRTD